MDNRHDVDQSNIDFQKWRGLQNQPKTSLPTSNDDVNSGPVVRLTSDDCNVVGSNPAAAGRKDENKNKPKLFK